MGTKRSSEDAQSENSKKTRSGLNTPTQPAPHADLNDMPTEQSPSTQEHIVSIKARFRGTNIDTLRANHPTLKLQPPSASPVAHAAQENIDFPPDSVGPPFLPPIQIHDQFIRRLETCRQPLSKWPYGIENRALSHCYRNAVLSMLMYSETFMAYVRTHLSVESGTSMLKKGGSPNLRCLQRMVDVVAGNEDRVTIQERLNTEVGAMLWKYFCDN